MSDDTPIRDNAEEGRWEIAVGEETAWLSYARGPSVIALIHTEVPDALAGMGLAGRLARHALAVARDAGLAVEPSCPFMIGWLDRHPEYQGLVHRPGHGAADDPFWL